MMAAMSPMARRESGSRYASERRRQGNTANALPLAWGKPGTAVATPIRGGAGVDLPEV